MADMSSSERELARSAAVGVWTLLGLTATLLWQRSLAGALVQPIPVAGVLLTSLVLISAAWLAERLWQRSEPSHQWPLGWIGFGLGFVAALPLLFRQPALAAGVICGGWLMTGLIAFAMTSDLPIRWFTVGWVESAKPVFDEMSNDEGRMTKAEEAGTTLRHSSLDIRHSELVGFADSAHSTNAEPALTCPDDATQWLVRRSEDAQEVLEGLVRIDFAAGVREVTVHVPFVPPLAGTPEVETEPLDGDDWSIQAAAFAYGLRLTVKRGRECQQPASGRVGYRVVGEVAAGVSQPRNQSAA